MMQTNVILDNLKANGQECPVCDEKDIRLTFEVRTAAECDEGYFEDAHFRIAGVTQPSGVHFQVDVAKGEQAAVVSVGAARERVLWWVECYRKGELIGRSGNAYFERGLLSDFRYGRWIEFSAFEKKVPLFYKKFEVHKQIARARLYITGLGYYVSYLNKKRTDFEFLKPILSDYNEREFKDILFYAPQQTVHSVYYNVFDVRELLQSGENELRVMLGSGWYWQKEKEVEGDYSYGIPKTLFELHIEYEDGSGEVVYSDERCRVRELPREASLFLGERMDFGSYAECWDSCGEEDGFAAICAKSPEGQLLAAPQCGDRLENELPPVYRYDFPQGTVLDFGKNHTGNLSLVLQGERGTQVSIIYGEQLTPDKKVDHYSTSWGVLVQRDSFVLSGNDDVFQAEFTVHAFRYAQISWNKPCKIKRAVSQEIHCYIPEYSEFRCSAPGLNRLAQVCIQTFVSNMHGGIPSDCPHRERRGYTGDGQVTCEAVMYGMNAEVFYRKWMKDILNAQDGISGYVPNSAPFSGGGGGPSWGYAVCEVPDVLYRMTGDIGIIRQALPHVRRWAGYLQKRTDGRGLVVKEELGWCLGEWFCPAEVHIPPEFVNTCVLIKSLRTLLRFCAICNEEEHGAGESLIRAIGAVNSAFLQPDGSYCRNIQGANLFALDAGIVPQALEKACWRACVQYFSEKTDYHVDTGIFGTKILFRMLFERGEAEIALKILQKTDFPSYGYMLSRGATTLWECWTEDVSPDYRTDDGTLCKGYPVSKNHPMFGSVLESLYRFVAGLDLSAVGSERTVYVRPVCMGYLRSASASVHTVYGRAEVGWSVKNNAVRLRVRVPFGCKAVLDTERCGMFCTGGDKKILCLPQGEHLIELQKKELVGNGI